MFASGRALPRELLQGLAVEVKDRFGSRQVADLPARRAKQIGCRFGPGWRFGVGDVGTVEVTFEKAVEVRASGTPETVRRIHAYVSQAVRQPESSVQGGGFLSDARHGVGGELGVVIIAKNEQRAWRDTGQELRCSGTIRVTHARKPGFSM